LVSPIDLFNKDLDSIEQQLEDGMDVNLDEEFDKKIDQIKYNIES
jgi:hypothetical protein